MLRKTLRTWLILIPVLVHAQGKTPSRVDVRLSKDKPILYITFDRVGQTLVPSERRVVESGTESTDRERAKVPAVWLRLHNNSRWAISFSTDSFYVNDRGIDVYRLPDGTRAFGLRDGMEISIQYRIVEADGHQVPANFHRSYDSLLLPGRSAVFSVMLDHLDSGRTIYVTFQYEWEKLKGLDNRQVQHRIYFDRSELPSTKLP